MIYVLFATVIILFFISFRIFDYEIVSPSVVTTGVFCISTLFTVLNVRNWNVKYSFTAYLIILIGFLLIIFEERAIKAYSMGKLKAVDMSDKIQIIKVDQIKTILIIIVSTICLFVYIRDVIKVGTAGSIFGGSIIYNFNQVRKHGVELGIDAGVGTLTEQLNKVPTVAAYIYMFIIINNLICKDKFKNNKLECVTIIIYFVSIFVSSTRIQYIYMMVYIVVVSFILNRYKKGPRKRVAKKMGISYIKKVFLGVVIGLPAFYLIGEFVMKRTTGNTLFSYISAYVGGSVQHFNMYIIDPPEKNIVIGEECFVYLYQSLNQLGLTDYFRTVHLEYRWLSQTIHGNVYTFFRRPIQDFGYIGLFVIILIVFGAYNYWYYLKLRKGSNSSNLYLKIIMFGYLYYPIALFSIDETATGLISLGNFFTYGLIVLMYYFVFKIKIKWR